MKNWILTTVCCALVFQLEAQDIQFHLKTSSDTLLAGHLLQLTYTVENAEVSDFNPPEFSPFMLVSGPQTSTSMQVFNGKVTRQSSITYQVFTDRPGKWVIKPARISVEGKTMECPEKEIVVEPNPSALPDPRFPGWRPQLPEPTPGDTLRHKLRKNRPLHRI